ncbi:MAG: NAD(P)H-dependent oxidoreductase subunit E [Gemmatimonadetes bacterium]|nr:NAD(P)H-dependent oxidoreductase subunit E [Gemmatimonadota bacterium]
MDVKLLDAQASVEERVAVDLVLGAPRSPWEGGARGAHRDYHTASGGAEKRAERTMLLPALRALQEHVGWVSEGGLNYVCERLDVPPAEAWGVATFYALLATTPRPRRVVHVCDDIACRMKGATALVAACEQHHGAPVTHAPPGHAVALSSDQAAWCTSPCLGLCDQAPAALVTEAGPVVQERLLGRLAPRRLHALLEGGPLETDASAEPDMPQRGEAGLTLLARVGTVDPTSLAAYRGAGGYAALTRAVALGAAGVIAELVASRLAGRGGAAFPTGRKWEAVAKQPPGPRYVVCNADESEPGTFKDRVLLTHDPFAIVEAMTIAAFATGATRGFLYVRGEYPLAATRIGHAITQARAAGLLGANVGGHGFAFDIEVRRGAGAYICGEETALFESIAGRRGEPRNKPPFPVEHGLFGAPTVANNVETLANVLPILLQGGATYAQTGSGMSTGTRLWCLSGAVARPGVYEAPMTITLAELIARAGGVAGGRGIKAVLLGGAAAPFVGPDQLGMTLSFEGARAAGASLGSGVVMVFDETADLEDAVLRIAAFFRDESCGQCVPCRVGTVRQEEALHRLAKRAPIGSVADEHALLAEIGQAMKDGSICGLGQTAHAAVESAIAKFGLFAGRSA